MLISTEAGGEGLNLHRNCHVMVNYDLPWNPSRLTQRIGRLYRYGQTKKVVVINLHARDTIDNEILSTVMDRLDVIISQMSSVKTEEFDDKYRADVMGELLERLNIHELRPLFRSFQQSRDARSNDPMARKECFDAIRDRIEITVADNCSRFRHPNSIVPVGILEG